MGSAFTTHGPGVFVFCVRLCLVSDPRGGRHWRLLASLLIAAGAGTPGRCCFGGLATCIGSEGPGGGPRPRAGRPVASPGPGQTCWSCSTRSPPTVAITGSRPGATTPGSGCGTYPRSGMPPAPARSAADLLVIVISNITSPVRQAAGRACATAGPSAGGTTGSSRTRGGTSISSLTAPSGGSAHPAVRPSRNRPGTPSKTRPVPSQVEHQVAGGLGAADQGTAVGGLVDGFGGVADRA